MQLLIEDSEKEAFDNLYSDDPITLPEFHIGDVRPLAVGLLKRIRNVWDSRLFAVQDISDWTIRAAIGAGFLLPTSGRWPLTFTAGDDSTEIFHNLSYNPTDIELQDALNFLSKIQEIGGVTVTGRDGFFAITFVEPEARNLLSGDPSQLVPLSILDFKRAVIGDDDTSEVQTLRILQNTGALASLETDTAAPNTSVAVVTQGDATHNHKVRVTLPENRWGGNWTYASAGVESALIGWDDNSAQIQAILEAVSTIGTGNITVQRETDDTLIISYKGTKGLQAIAGIAVDGSALQVISTKSGTLDLRGPGVEYLIPNGQKSAVVSFAVEGTPPGGSPEIIYQRDMLLVRPAIEQASVQPAQPDLYYTKDEIDARTGDSADLTVSTTGTSDLAPAAPFTTWFQKVIAGAGAGAYTRKLTLDTSEATDGAIFRVYIELAASTNPTIEIRNESASGTLLQTVAGDSSNARYFYFEAEFDVGTNAWRKIFGGYLA